MIRRILGGYIGWLLGTALYAQSLPADSLLHRLWQQSQLYPQEKLYLHTDRSTYATGDTLWMRAYVVDAALHQPTLKSRYAYVELISPLGNVEKRLRLRQDENGAIHGHLALPDTLPSGSYQLRSYTRFMENQPEDLFFHRHIRVMNPLSRSIRIQAQRTSNRHLRLRFIHPVTQQPVPVRTLRVFSPEGEILCSAQKDGSWESMHRTSASLFRVQAGNFQEYLSVDRPRSYAVDFFPEGGYLLDGVLSKVAFKALNEDGLGETITGEIQDDRDSVVATFSSLHRGMGYVSFIPSAARKYRARCVNNDGTEKVISLPEVSTNGQVLKVERHKGTLSCRLLSATHAPLTDSLYLLVQQRGIPRLARACMGSGESVWMFRDEDFSEGLVQFLLVDASLRIRSERKVFIAPSPRQEGSALHTDQPSYAAREKVTLQLDFNGREHPVPNGSCSVAVTHNRDVRPDSLSDIVSHLLLASDLKGHIEHPSWYFAPGQEGLRHEALDVLMLTQGWTRYEVVEALQNHFRRPTLLPEASMVLEGKVTTRLLRKPVRGTSVGISSPAVGLLEYIQTDNDGRFRLQGFEFPDTTRYLVSAFSRSGTDKVVLEMDLTRFPAAQPRMPETPGTVTPTAQSRPAPNPMEYLTKVDTKSTYDKGIRHIYMDEVLITAPRKSPYRTPTEVMARNVRREKDFEKRGLMPMGDAIAYSMIPGVFMNKGRLTFRGHSVRLYIDGIVADAEYASLVLETMLASDIKQADFVVPDPNHPLSSAPGDPNAALFITLKSGDEWSADYSPTNIGVVQPLGYQPPAAFYSPRYAWAGQKEQTRPDLRTTLYWNPNVMIRNGQAAIEFYTADGTVDYSVVIEGVGQQGEIIHETLTLSSMQGPKNE